MTCRANQRLRTRTAIVRAAAELSRTGREVTMPQIAKAALVSEATAYRYFPDLVSLLREAIADQLPAPGEALTPAADSADSTASTASADPVERIAAAAELLLRHILAREGVVRAMIAATILHPADAVARPALRFDLIDHALGPLTGAPAFADPAAVTRLKRGLATVVSAEALFTLTDLYGLDPEAAVAGIVHTATTLTRASLRADG